MTLELLFNRLCNMRHGWLMIPVVGIGILGFFILLTELVRYFFL